MDQTQELRCILGDALRHAEEQERIVDRFVAVVEKDRETNPASSEKGKAMDQQKQCGHKYT